MTNCTTVDLIVRAADMALHKDVFEAYDAQAPYQDAESGSVNGGLICLTYQNVKYANLGFEPALQARRIPYDKCWGNSDDYDFGSQHCRVSTNGSLDIKTFDGPERNYLPLVDVANAYQNGQLDTFLNTALEKRSVMSWDEQETILQRLGLPITPTSQQRFALADSLHIIEALLNTAALDPDTEAQDCLTVFNEYAWSMRAGSDESRFMHLISAGKENQMTQACRRAQ